MSDGTACLQGVLVFAGRSEHLLYVFWEAQLAQGPVDMLRRNCFLGFVFGDFVGLEGYQGDEFDAACYEQVPSIFCESDSWRGLQYLGDNL